MELVERPTPEPDADEALIEVEYAGLCGSDARIYEFESAFERMNLPNVIGHEYSGRVVEVGEASGDVDCETFLDDRFSLLDADEAFETFVAGGTCKPVFDVSELRE